MEKRILTLDVGTTNSRIRSWVGNILEEEIKIPIGVKSDKEILTSKIQENINILKNKKSEIEGIIASGMITSNLGLCHIDHLTLPVTLNKLAENIEKKEICGIPTYYITGIKTTQKLDELNLNDVIRGEEVEVFGILKKLQIKEECIIILPGSHNKFILVNRNHEILDFSTTISGELLEIITKNSILKNSLDASFCDELNYKFLQKGYFFSKEKGFGKALFSLRSLDLFNDLSLNEKSSYLLGIIIQQDIESLVLNKFLTKERTVIIGGAGNFVKAMDYLLKENIPDVKVKIINDNKLSSIGALEIAKVSSLINL